MAISIFTVFADNGDNSGKPCGKLVLSKKNDALYTMSVGYFFPQNHSYPFSLWQNVSHAAWRSKTAKHAQNAAAVTTAAVNATERYKRKTRTSLVF
ncbi:MAG TPA: hypothetical protein DCY48_03610 [Candidatus Magasanikbacteria bacterium]|nr:MAG: hypothetical protein A3I74_04665 [Candidatus Magasanikbacteria bacterium RIFCSPLOWO2_02_FULL_47_16]OGH79498.1 MAG: hypothetical protein A3C10_01635 [Candidatus Magasanikbacteria bacterium RIFCSPHIGHO2_02_FULL_48_18]OGH83156.1 MAG: hypothetical protein A3G08_04525 [Candidatus Magasanikbacteria bacterium RIFCSPLOWO2_12_FULL_47_9b]HAZ28831.1 hypothetical protein [Candidatus Magasanikbacteria bacterium]